MNVLVLHPGAMGASVGRTLVNGGARVMWVSEGRSAETTARANDGGLKDAGSLSAGVSTADVVLSVCPPDQAMRVAASVADLGFAGIYVDANAVSPQSSHQIAGRFGDRFVDGGIIGPPAAQSGTTRLYLSGPRAAQVSNLFVSGPLEAIAMEAPAGAASALKMAYAAYTKGSAALLLTTAALAESAGVTPWLREEWGLSQPGLAERAERSAAHVGPKSWRFAGEMDEIAQTMEWAGLPNGFHRAAADAYQRLSSLKGASSPTLADVLALLSGTPAADVNAWRGDD